MYSQTPNAVGTYMRISRLRTVAIVTVGIVSIPLVHPQTLLVQPTPIAATSAGFQAQARVVFQNSGSDTVREVSLSSFSNDHISAQLGRPPATEVLPKGQLEWPVSILVPSSAHLPGLLVFDVSYKTGKVVGHVYASLPLQADLSQKLVDVTLDGTPDPISQQRPSAVYLIVANNLDLSVNVSAVPQPTYGGLKIPSIDPFHVPPHSMAAQRVELQTGFRVTPGVQPAAIDVAVDWTRDGQKDERHFVLTKPVTVGVFFESELLKALSVPSFLLLPGCLFIFTMQLMLSLGVMGLKNQSNLPDLTIASPGFWILSVSFSTLFVGAYYLITGVNCLLSYGLNDMGIVWIVSILFGAGFFLLIGWRYQDWRKEHVVTSADTPPVIINKLAKNGLSLRLPRVKFKLGNQELSGYVIENIGENQTMAWVSPHIAVVWKDSAEAQAQKREFERVMNGNRDPNSLASMLNASANLVTMNFDTAGVVPNPYHLKLDAVTEYLPSDLIVG
jgi:hypothetical protein